MSERIITLFGEEVVPEQVKPVGKSRAKNNAPEKKTEEKAAPEITTYNEVQPESNKLEENEPEIFTEPEAITISEVQQDIHDEEENEPEVLTEPEITALDEIQEESDEPGESKPEGQTAPEIITINEVTPDSEITTKEPKKEVVTTANKKTKKAKLPDEYEGDKQYYSIGEVAALFKVNTSHIRFWTNEFKLKVRTTRKGDRLFTPDQIKELRTIHHLVKERGFTLSGAKAKLKKENKIDVETIDLKQSLLQLRNKLQIIRNQLV